MPKDRKFANGQELCEELICANVARFVEEPMGKKFCPPKR
jgi:hypothetical protein